MPRLLLVDDNPSIHKIVASLLDSTAIGVLHANDAEEALKFIESGAEFDVALVDTSLPKIDGWELLERIRSDARTESRPVAMMAGVLEDVDLARVEKAPIQAFLRKPVDLRDLSNKVEALVAMPNMRTMTPLQPAEPAAPPDAPLQSAEPAVPPDVPSQPAEPAAPPDAPLQPTEPAVLPDVPSQPAEPAVLPDVPLQPAEPAPSDILVLEAQDLAQEIALAELSEADAHEAEGSSEECAMEETISIELEDLDLSKIDQLVASGDEQPGFAQGGQGCDPDNFLDTAPGDFGPELMLEDGQAGPHSPIANELLADREFIKALAKEVAKSISLRGIDA